MTTHRSSKTDPVLQSLRNEISRITPQAYAPSFHALTGILKEELKVAGLSDEQAASWSWPEKEGNLLPVDATGVPLPERFRDAAALVSLLTENGMEKLEATLSAPARRVLEIALEIRSASEALKAAEAARIRLALASSRAALEGWQGGNLLSVIEGKNSALKALSKLSVSLQKEAYILLSENYLLTRGSHYAFGLKVDYYGSREKNPNRVFAPSNFSSSLPAILRAVLPFLKDVRLSDEQLLQVTFTCVDVSKGSVTRFLDARPSTSEKALKESLDNLESFLDAQDDFYNLVNWVASGRDRETRRIRAILAGSFVSTSANLPNEENSKGFPSEPAGSEQEIFQHVMRRIVAGAGPEEVFELFEALPHWGRVLLLVVLNIQKYPHFTELLKLMKTRKK